MRAPRFARFLVGRAVDPAERPYILAEADDEFAQRVNRSGRAAARRWYWSQARAAVSLRVFHPRGPGRSSGFIRRAVGQSARAVRRQPLFVSAVVATLALGVSATTVVYALVEVTLLRPLPYSAAERLAVVSSFNERDALPDRDISGPDYFDLVERNTVFLGLTAYELAPGAIRNADGNGVRVELARVGPSLFAILGVEPLAGRVFDLAEVGPAAPRHAVLSAALASRRFGAPAAALGRVLQLDGEPFTVVGVVERRPPLDGADVDLWVPLPYGPLSLRRQAGVLRVVARLQDGVSSRGAEADLDRIGRALEDEFPESNLGRRYVVRPLREVLTAEFQAGLGALALAVSLLFAVAVINASGLLLVRYVQRRREFAVRAAVGGARIDLVGQLVGEGLILGTLAGAISAGMATVALAAVRRHPVASAALLGDPQPNGAMVLAGVTAAVVASLAATSVALWSAPPGTHGVARQSPSDSGTVRAWLLTGQIAVTTVLIVSVTLLGRSLQNVAAVDPGFDPQQLVATALDLPAARYPTDMTRYPDWPQIHTFYSRLDGELDALASLDGAALAWHHPLKRGWLTRFLPDGAAEIPVGQRELVNLRAVSPGYFAVVGARMLAGRPINESDVVEGERVVVVNRTLETRFFGADGATGKRVHVFGQWWRVVGVVDDFKSHGLAVATRPAVFPPLRQMPSETIQVVARGTAPAVQLLDDLREAVWAVDPGLAPYDGVALEAVIADATADRRMLVWLFGWFGVLAVLLSATGLVGTVFETIESRRRELGLRAALGAWPGQLVRYVLYGNARIILAGVGAGLLGALALSRFLTGWLFGVSPTSQAVYWTGGAVMFLVASLASIVPAARVLRCQPVDLLRQTES